MSESSTWTKYLLVFRGGGQVEVKAKNLEITSAGTSLYLNDDVIMNPRPVGLAQTELVAVFEVL